MATGGIVLNHPTCSVQQKNTEYDDDKQKRKLRRVNNAYACNNVEVNYQIDTTFYNQTFNHVQSEYPLVLHDSIPVFYGESDIHDVSVKPEFIQDGIEMQMLGFLFIFVAFVSFAILMDEWQRNGYVTYLCAF